MKKILQILLGFFLILVLAYFSFLEVSNKIKEDLLSKAKSKFIDKGIVGINAQIEGEGLSLTRTLTLTGTVGSEKQRSSVASLVASLDGVDSVDNQIIVKPYGYSVFPTVGLAPLVMIKKAIVPVAKTVTKTVAVPEELEEKKPIKAEVIVESVVSVKKAIVPIAVIEPKVNEVKNSEVVVNIPAVPVVNQTIPTVPTAIKVIAVPIAVEAEKAIVNEENKNIKTQGVQ